MPDIHITPRAAKFIADKCKSPAVAARREAGSIPRLKWATRVTWTDTAGVAKELGPRFFFSWASPKESLEAGDLMVNTAGVGRLALAPASFLGSGEHIIDLSGDHLVLTATAIQH
jgi:hypothetical protein